MKIPLLIAALLASASVQAAEVRVTDVWARATVPGQKVSGAYMKIQSDTNAKLVGASSTAISRVEVHEMKMDGDVMRMRQIDALELPEGQMVELKPGGYHLMFQQLKAPLKDGSDVPVTLVFQDAKGATSRLHLQVPVKRTAPGAGQPGKSTAPAHGHGHGH